MAKIDPVPEPLLAWIRDHANGSIYDLEQVKKLVNAQPETMGPVWRELRKQKIDVILFCSLIRGARNAADVESKRDPSAKAEVAKLKKVARLARELKAAISESSLPAQWGQCGSLECEGKPSIPLLIGWSGLPANGYGLGHYPLQITSLLDLTAELVETHIAELPPRAVTRRHGRATVAVFVRVLTYLIWRECQKSMHAAVGVVASVLFDLDAESPLTTVEVQAILKDQPSNFSRRKKKDGAA